MEISIKAYCDGDVPEMMKIWNQVVEEARAFPQMDILGPEEARKFFASQSHCGIARDDVSGKALGLYILHPNNLGRCGHICNASYAVDRELRGRGIGAKLVLDSLRQARGLGFGVMQFNAVVLSNTAAHHLYPGLGFKRLGTVPGGFLRADGTYEDIVLYYFDLRALPEKS